MKTTRHTVSPPVNPVDPDEDPHHFWMWPQNNSTEPICEILEKTDLYKKDANRCFCILIYIFYILYAQSECKKSS